MGTEDTNIVSRQLQLTASRSECNRLFKFLDESLAQLPVNLEFKHDIKLVCEELLANIINHGYDGESGDNSIGIRLTANSKRLQISFTDSARAYNPLENDASDALNDLSEGGMGLLLVKSLTDLQHYSRDDSHNVLTVTKNYNK